MKMRTENQIQILNNFTLKSIALIFGSLIWFSFTRNLKVIAPIKVPIYFCSQQDIKSKDIEYIIVYAYGTKKEIVKSILNQKNSVQIDIENKLSKQLIKDEAIIDILPEDILLNNLNLINYYPSQLTIKVNNF